MRSSRKQSGVFWTVRGANSIIALRCCQLNGRLETYWRAGSMIFTFMSRACASQARPGN
jgi:hypothetical protein